MIFQCIFITVRVQFHVVFARLTTEGMNDVLPKPFTKEGLLQMLEKHLGHLKRLPDGMEAIMHHPSSSIAQGSAAQSLKDESSPNQSPSTISNWQSPGQFPGISPTNHTAPPHQFVQPMHPQAAYGMGQSPIEYQPPHTPLGAPRQNQHRRHISELANPDEFSNDPKRQRIYAQTNAIPMNQMQRGRSG